MSIIKSAGHYFGENILTNEDIASRFDTDFDLSRWIVEKTGIRQRRESSLLPSEQGAIAGKMALSGIEGGVDFLLVNTFYGDHAMPQTATLIQRRLELENAFAFEINMPCAGPIYTMALADMMLQSGNYERALLIGVDDIRGAIDQEDYVMNAIFGDGAGAVVLERSSENAGIAGHYLGSAVESTDPADFSLKMMVGTANGVRSERAENNRNVLQMKSWEVKHFIISKLEETVQWLLENHLSDIGELDYIITHQANKRVIEQCLEKLKIPKSKNLTTAELYGNTASASIFLTLSHHFDTFSQPGRNVLFCGMGGGLTWGAIFYKT